MFLSYIAWNRVTVSAEYMEDEYKQLIADFDISKQKLKRELISTDWEKLVLIMMEYKRDYFCEDNRVITACGFTPQNTLRVEWK